MPKIEAVWQFIYDAFRNNWDRLANVLKVSEQFPDSYDAAQDAKKVETIFYTIRSAKAVNFTGAIVQNAKQDATLTGLASNKIRIKRMKFQSLQNLAWQLYCWKTSTTDDTDLDIDSFCGRVTLSAAQGEQIGGANQYYYDSGPLDIIYECLDGTFALDISLVNRDAVAKIAGASGYAIVEVEYEPAS